MDEVKIPDEITNLINQGYEDLTLSESSFIEFMKRYSYEIPLLIDNKKVWIHIDNRFDVPILELDINDGSAVKLSKKYFK